MPKYNTSCPSGFPERTPAQERVYQQWISVIRDVFEKNGFMSVTTPLVERQENLLAKGGNAKEMYVLKRILDEEGDKSHSGNALRFDHTVPLALYVARHLNEISFPFRRYSIGPVLRGERAQKGRFRQFDQCDIDVIGSENLSLLNDAQMPAIIIEIFERLMPENEFIVRLNNRKILLGFFSSVGVSSENIKSVLDAVDDLEKIGKEKVEHQLQEIGLTGEQISQIIEFTTISGTNDEVLDQAEKFVPEGVSELREVVKALRDMGVDEKKFKVDLAIARGLDYYTGTVYETNLIGYEGLGSICSGGRYDDLAEMFTGKKLPGVGISIGITRLLSQLFDAGLVNVDRSSPSEVLVMSRMPEAIPKCLEIGQKLRAEGIAAEVYSEPKKIQKQFDYAKKLGIPVRVIVGDDIVVEGEEELKAKIEDLI